MKEQLNVRLDAALARLVKQEAQEQCRTVGGIVALALEAWLSKASSDLAGDSSSPDQQALAALEARVARLEAIASLDIVKTKNNDEINRDNIKVKNNDENRPSDRSSKTGDNVTRFAIDQPGGYNIKSGRSQSTTQRPDNVRASKGRDNVTTSHGLTTAELAIQTSTNKGAWNTWASKASPGDIRHHAQAGSWRLLGKAALASGGPPRWLWEEA